MNSCSPTVLVIEDDEQVRNLLHRVLIYSNVNVVEAATGEEGVALAGKLLPEAIICDFRLPGIDGVQTVERLRAGPATFEIPVILISGKSGDLQNAMAPLPHTQFLPKPFLISDLVKRIKEVTAPSASGTVAT